MTVSSKQVTESVTPKETLATVVIAGALGVLLPSLTLTIGIGVGLFGVAGTQLVHYAERAYREGIPRPDRRGRVTTGQAAAAGGTTAVGAAAIMSDAGEIIAEDGLVGLVTQGFGGVLYAGFLELINIIQSAGSSLFAPIRAFSGGVASVVSAVFPARIINDAADFTSFSLTQGDWNFFGPFTFFVGVVATLLGLYAFLYAARSMNLSPTVLFWRN